MKKLLTFGIFFIMFSPIPSIAQKTSKMEDKSYSIEIIRYNIPEQERSHFEKSYEAAGEYLQASEFCLGYQVIHGNEEPNHYIVIIHWTSQQEHLQGFRKSKVFIPFFDLVKPFYAHIEEMKHYEPTSNKWKRE
ncbi:MAG TPA: antibiotic biosynthesis monooxygenase family protein [Pseudosphingobacterium sp.]|nr:antibiotic biosynthesis monooxygenase family protein [Pseudosphingobacterium sp.]